MKRKERKFSPEYMGAIAHRGLHNSEYTENGLKAFKNAIDNGFAFELDIHITKDGQLVVCHDDDLKRTTGKEGIIEELTLAEIKENYRLLDGGEVPTFQEVLDLNKEQRLIVVELKVHEGNYKPLAKAARKALKQIKDKKKIILFDGKAAVIVMRDFDW
jgi:glycerophosphoryl diester phosphodiesterase